MTRIVRPTARTRHIYTGRVLLALLELPAAAAALWLAWTLAESNPLEEIFENSMVNFVPSALIPYLLYMSIAALGSGWSTTLSVPCIAPRVRRSPDADGTRARGVDRLSAR
ncbi:hypothetical protein TESS_TESS_00526 [Tessaracoccus sp. O5.2]|uniref:hypothetical protein n=1 Tax=Tessaracoccus sp. O5.2 TaxID=3157622 RepID=UPI0035E5EACF